MTITVATADTTLITVLCGFMTVTGFVLGLGGRRYPLAGLAGTGMALAGWLGWAYLAVHSHKWGAVTLPLIGAAGTLWLVHYYAVQLRAEAAARENAGT